MRTRMGRVFLALGFSILGCTLAGCMQAALEANQRQLEQQQAELDNLTRQVAALQAQRSSYATASPAAPGVCDRAVMAAATRKAGERLAAGDATHALGYYQDAASACSTSAQAQLNLAHALEMSGDRAQALAHYRLAAAATAGDTGAEAVRNARKALGRLGEPAK